MSDRVILAVKYTPAAAPGQLRKAVGGFLRYVQYRDKHKDSEILEADPKVSGLLKYVAHRDGAANRGRLFGPDGPVADVDRRDLANFVTRSIAATRPQLGQRDGVGVDRRRAVYRFVLSPEHADGLDLRSMTKSAIRRLEREAGGAGLRWIAAEHRNTAHPHVHIVLAGMREESPGNYRGLVITPRRLAAMKEELALEITRQREALPRTSLTRTTAPAGEPLEAVPAKSPLARLEVHIAAVEPRAVRVTPRRRPRVWPHPSTFMRLQAAALRYRRRLERDEEEERRLQLREVDRW